MDAITIDGLDENEFRRSIETMLRNGEADDAAAKLRALLEPYAGPGKLLPARFLTVSPQEVSLAGWQDLRARIGQYDRPENQISALRIALTDPDPEAPLPAPDSSGRLSPLIETSYFSDNSFPFSEADRNDLLDGYSMDDSAWQGDFEAADSAVKVEGIEDLYGSVAALEARVMGTDQPDGEEIRAGSLGACFLAVLVHQAVRETVKTEGLPRALCVMAGNDGIYPYFDAPVLSRDEYPDDGATMTTPLNLSPATSGIDETDPEEISEGPYDFSRLSGMTSRKARKTPVIMLDAEEADLATHQFDAGAAQQLAEADAHEHASLLAMHEPAHPAVDTPTSDFEPQGGAWAEPAPVAEADEFEHLAAISESLPPQDTPSSVPDHAPALQPVQSEALVADPEDSDTAAFNPETAQPKSYHYAEAEPFSPEPSRDVPPVSSVRALRARMAVEPDPEPSLVDRLMNAVRRMLASLGLG